VPDAPLTSDPLVADLANKIEALYPGHVVGVNIPLQSTLGATDADILLQNAVIQVKSGGGAQGLLLQLQKSEAATGLPALGFGPNLPGNSLRALSGQGAMVTGDEQLPWVTGSVRAYMQNGLDRESAGNKDEGRWHGEHAYNTQERFTM